MTKPNSLRVLWVYEKNHLKQPFIQLGAQSLEQAGYPVTILDTSNEIPGKQAYQHLGLVAKLKGKRLERLLVSRIYKGYGARKVSSILALLMFREIIRRRPSVIIASLPLGLAVGRIASRLLKARLIYYPLELYGEQSSSFSIFLKRIEKLILGRGVHALVTQNKERASVYERERNARVSATIVHNYKRYCKVSRTNKLRELLSLPQECKIVLYEGYLMHGRGLEHLLESTTYLPEDVRLVLMGKIKDDWRRYVGNVLDDPRTKSRILIAPWVEPKNLFNYVGDADVGVIIYDNRTRNNYYCEPGKLSDYVLSGVPVVGPNFPTIGPVIRRYPVGEVFENLEPKEIARAISSVLSKSRDYWEVFLAQAQTELVWETQIRGFLKAVAG